MGFSHLDSIQHCAVQYKVGGTSKQSSTGGSSEKGAKRGRQKDVLPNCKRGWERPGDKGIHLGRYCRVARQTKARRRGGPIGLTLTYLVQVGRKGMQVGRKEKRGPRVVREASID